MLKLLKNIKALFNNKATKRATFALAGAKILAAAFFVHANINTGNTPENTTNNIDTISSAAKYEANLKYGYIVRPRIKASPSITLHIKDIDLYQDIEKKLEEAKIIYANYKGEKVPEHLIEAAFYSEMITGVPIANKIMIAYHESNLCKINESSKSRAKGCFHFVPQTALGTIYQTKGTFLEDFFPESSLIRQCTDDNGKICYGVYFKDTLRRDRETENKILDEILNDTFRAALLSDKLMLDDIKSYKSAFPKDKITEKITYMLHFHGKNNAIKFRKNLISNPNEYAYEMHSKYDDVTGEKIDGRYSREVQANLPIYQKTVINPETGKTEKQWRTFAEIDEYFEHERKVGNKALTFSKSTLLSSDTYYLITQVTQDKKPAENLAKNTVTAHNKQPKNPNI